MNRLSPVGRSCAMSGPNFGRDFPLSFFGVGVE